MSLWWVALLLLGLGLAVWAITFMNRRADRRSPVLVANSGFLDGIPSFRRSQTLAQVLRVLSVLAAVGGLLGAAVLSGRVATENVQSPGFASRDIVLCLDISGSMYEYDTEIMETFADLVETFDGERVALSIFNSTSRTVFPLTNDYELIERELRHGAEALDFDEFGYRLGQRTYSEDRVRMYMDFVEGTRGVADQASIIPDGLASCNLLFDQAETDRSRSVIFVTDNEVNGEPLFTLQEAADASVAREIDIFTFYPGAYECGPSCAEELRTVTEDSGGVFYSSRDPDAIPAIVQQIQLAQAEMMGGTPIVLRTDHPLPGFVLTVLALGALLLVGWRTR
ncbi:MAG: VWA domain-containing protein [Brachybacterium sp.]|nr:VWA domain-containing protein [Brachybacterium sp.]